MIALRWIMLVGILIAGCTSPPGDKAEDPHNSMPEATGPEIVLGPQAPSLTNILAVSDCHGFLSTFDAPAQRYADEAPSAWRYDGVAPKHYGFLGYFCNRVGLGAFERPAEIIFEFHSNAQPPESCYEPFGEAHQIIRNVYLSDAYLATAFRNATAIEPIPIQAKLIRDTTVATHSLRYQWTSTYGTSYVDLAYTEFDEGSLIDEEVWLGASDAGPWRLNLTGTASSPGLDLPLGIGNLTEETLHAKLYGSDWVGTSVFYTQIDFVAELSRFADWDCMDRIK